MTEFQLCPDCAEEVRAEARVCKHCGCKLYRRGLSWRRKRLVVVGILLAVAFVLLLLWLAPLLQT